MEEAKESLAEAGQLGEADSGWGPKISMLMASHSTGD